MADALHPTWAFRLLENLHRNWANEISFHIIVCVHGTVVFLSSCKIHLAAYTAGQILLNRGVDCLRRLA
jgi:hypothetical protein